MLRTEETEKSHEYDFLVFTVLPYLFFFTSLLWTSKNWNLRITEFGRKEEDPSILSDIMIY